MYLHRTPELVKKLFPQFTWNKSRTDKCIYLTFDDGPIPEVTPWVLEQLNAYGAKATFFCVGENVCTYRPIYQELIAQGHRVGNHTYHHLDGWATPTLQYLENYKACGAEIESQLFRPPYGRLRPAQAQAIRESSEIVLWDVLSGDFDPKLSKEACLQQVLTQSQNGSIIVFHDSLKAWNKLEYVLPKVLAHFQKEGYRFGVV
jgi:peptidoglycan-N-acetylglucosamine deacetylase